MPKGESKKDDKVLVQTRIKPALHKKIKRLADQEGISVAAYVRRIIYREYTKDTGKSPV